MRELLYCPEDFLGRAVFSHVLDFLSDPVLPELRSERLTRVRRVKIDPLELSTYCQEQQLAVFGVPYEPSFVPLQSKEIFRTQWGENTQRVFAERSLALNYLLAVFEQELPSEWHQPKNVDESDPDLIKIYIDWQQSTFTLDLKQKVHELLRDHVHGCPDCTISYLEHIHEATVNQIAPYHPPASLVGVMLHRPIIYVFDREAINKELLALPLSELEEKILKAA